MAASSFDWSHFLSLATLLASNADEASQRNSISRAYYCVYHKASERAILMGYVDQKSHWKLWDLYDRNKTDRNCRKLSFLGSRMHKERKEADYEATTPRLSERATVQLAHANKFVAILSTLGPGLPKP